MKPAVATTLALTAALIVLMIIWIAPVAGAKNSACEQYPLTSGCR